MRNCGFWFVMLTIPLLSARIFAADATIAFATPDGIAQPFGENDIQILNRFVVVADRIDGPPWRYATIPGYEILSRCKDSETKDWITRLLRGNQEMSAMLPDGCLSQLGAPVSVILYNSDAESGAVAAAVPSLGSASIDEALLGWGTNKGTSPGSRVEDLDTIEDCLRLPSFRQFFTGSFHLQPARAVPFGFRLRKRVPEFPSWLIEGLIGPNGVFTHHVTVWSDEDKSPCMFISMARWVSKEQTRLVVDGKGASIPLIPLSSLFSKKTGDGQDPTSVWSSEAALFVRWGLYGAYEDEPSDPHKFWSFVNQCTPQTRVDEAFRRSFGFGYDEMEVRLDRYLPKAVNDLIKIRLPIEWEPSTPNLRDATPSEIGRLIGDWERLKGDSYRRTNGELSRRLLQEALKIMMRSSSKSPNDPQLIGAIGLLNYDENDSTNAVRNLGKAADARVIRPIVYLRLAQLRYDGYVGKYATSEISTNDAQQVIEPLQIAETQSPALRETYKLLAKTCLHCQTAPNVRIVSILEEGSRLFPSDQDYLSLLQQVRLHWNQEESQRSLQTSHGD
jgi:hypothetical protein